MTTLFLLAYTTVLVAELVGDKTLYTFGMLAAEFRLTPILIGAAFAFMLKMGAAVALGHVISGLPEVVVTALSAGTFFVMALAFLLKRRKPETSDAPRKSRSSSAVLVSFVAIFLPEWGDPGQLAAALLVAQGKAPLLVWCAATLAMVTKALAAAALGAGLRKFVPQNAMRLVSAVVFLILGVVASFRVEL